jgi:GH25 family lysozyme M1 (1,4-beta-N-acetylmuramidase)
MNHFLAVVGSDPGELPLTIDVELHHNVHPDRFRARLHQALEYLKQRTHRTPIIYSRASFFDTYVTGVSAAPTWYSLFDWWLAHYLLSGEEHKGPPPLPKGVPRPRVIIHQTSDRGKPFGVESKALDYNRWQFPIGHFRSYIVTSEQPAPVDTEGRLRRLEFSIRDFFEQIKK